MNSALLRQVEQTIQQQQKLIALGESLERLKNNQDFRKLIMEGYFVDEAVRLVHLKADPGFQSVDAQKSIDLQILSVGSLSQYLNVVRATAEMASKTVADCELTREELLQEGA